MEFLTARRLLRNATRFSSACFSSSLPSKKNPSSKAVDDMVNDILKERDLTAVVQKFIASSDVYRFRSKHRVYEITFRRLASAQRFADIERILDAQKRYPDITNEGFAVRLITLCGKSRMFEHARKLFDEMPELKCPRTVKSFNALLSAAVESGAPERVPGLFQQLSSELSIKPDAISFNVLILAHCKMGTVDDALMVLETMDANGIRPVVITFNTLLRGLYGQNRVLDAERMWRKMEQLNLSPDVISFNEKLEWLASEGKAMEALELMKEMGSRELKPDTFSFNSLIKAFCDGGNMEEAKRTFEDLKKNDCAPNWRTFEIIIPFLLEKGEVLYASKLAKESISRRLRINSEVLQQVVNGLVKFSLKEEAEKLLQIASKSSDSERYDVRLPSQEEDSAEEKCS